MKFLFPNCPFKIIIARFASLISEKFFYYRQFLHSGAEYPKVFDKFS